jgi:ADP-dependent glucokinase
LLFSYLQVFSKINSIGLNEQELAFISYVVGGPHTDLYESSSLPPVHKVIDIMSWIMTTFAHHPQTRPRSRLTRLHFHTLSYHIIAVLPSTWENLSSAVAAGTKQAGRLACNSQDLDPAKMVLKMPLAFKLFSDDPERSFDPMNPVSSFNHNGIDFALSPVLVCKEPIKTVGLGDSISATGLLYSTFIIKL